MSVGSEEWERRVGRSGRAKSYGAEVRSGSDECG